MARKRSKNLVKSVIWPYSTFNTFPKILASLYTWRYSRF